MIRTYAEAVRLLRDPRLCMRGHYVEEADLAIKNGTGGSVCYFCADRLKIPYRNRVTGKMEMHGQKVTADGR